MRRIINILILSFLPFITLAQLGTASPDNSLLATFVYDQGQYRFLIHDLRTGRLVKKINAGFQDLDNVRFTHDKKFIIALSHNTLYVFNLDQARLVRKFYQTTDFDISDNNFLAVISNSYPYTVNLSTGQQQRYSISVGKTAHDITLSPDARHLSVVTADQMVYVYSFSQPAPLDVFHGNEVRLNNNQLVILRNTRTNVTVSTYSLTQDKPALTTQVDVARVLQSAGLPAAQLMPEKSILSPDGRLLAVFLNGGQIRRVIILDTHTGQKKAMLDNSSHPFQTLQPIAWSGNGTLILEGKGLDGLEYDPATGVTTTLHWEMYNPSHKPALLPKEQKFRRRFSPDYHYVVMTVYEGSRRFLLVRDALVDRRQISYADADFITFSHDSRQMFLLIKGVVFQLNTRLIRQAMEAGTVARLTQLGTAVYGQVTEQLKPHDDPPPAGYHYPFTQKTINVTDLDTQRLFVLLRGMNLDPKNVQVKLNLIDNRGHIITGATNPQWLYLWCNLLVQNKSLQVEQKNFIVKEVHETEPTAYALVLDHSGSMGDQRANALQFGAWQLIHQKKPHDAFLLIKYDNRPRLEVKLTTNPSSFYAPLNNTGLKGYGGGTALNDAAYLAITELAKATGYKRRVIYLFTDGYENASQHTKTQVLRAALHNGIEIFTIGFGRDVNDKYLQDLAYLTGGAYYHIYHTSELKKIFLDVDIKRRYYYSVKFVTNYPGRYIALLQLCQDFNHHDSVVVDFTNDPKVPPEKSHIQVNPQLTPAQRRAFAKKTIPCRPPDKPVQDTRITQEFNQIEFPNIYFAFNSDRIVGSDEKGLQQIAAFMKRHPDVYLRIEGHTDSIGSYQYNIDLSKRRAEAAKKLLVKYGIAPGRIFTVGYGYTRPLATNRTDQGRHKNRRIEFKIFRY